MADKSLLWKNISNFYKENGFTPEGIPNAYKITNGKRCNVAYDTTVRVQILRNNEVIEENTFDGSLGHNLDTVSEFLNKHNII